MASATFVNPAMFAPDYEVVFSAVLFGVRRNLTVDALHNAVEFLINFLERPAEAETVLAHFERGGRYAASVRRLAGSKEDAVFLQVFDRVGSGGHIRAFGNDGYAVFDEGFRVFEKKFVLGSAGKSDVALNLPYVTRGRVFRIRAERFVFAEASAIDFFDLLDRFKVDSLGIVNPAGGVGHGNDFRAELRSLFGGVNRNVARARKSQRFCR